METKPIAFQYFSEAYIFVNEVFAKNRSQNVISIVIHFVLYFSEFDFILSLYSMLQF